MSRRLNLSDPWLTTSQVARMFDVCGRTVASWAATGKIPAVKTNGGHYRIRHSDVKAVLDAR